MFLGILFVLPFFAGIFALLGAIFLRASVWLANKLVANEPPTAQVIEPPKAPPQLPMGQSDPSNPFAAPLAVPVLETDFRPQKGIPTPTFLKAIGVCLLFFISLLPVTIAGEFLNSFFEYPLLSYAWVFLASAAIGVAMIRAWLPTTWKRATLVAFFFALILIAVAIIFSLAIGLIG